MKKIIDRKKYDTETAIKIGIASWWDESVSFDQTETLYLKKTGEYFRYDEKRTTWGNICNYFKIVPISLDDAKNWVELHLNREYETIFGKVEE